MAMTSELLPENNTIVDFRAPPPSPVASGRRSSFTNEDLLSDFLENSLKVPDLILPDRIFPRQKTPQNPPKLDFESLASLDNESILEFIDSVSRTGCFEVFNHGAPRDLIMSALAAQSFTLSYPKIPKDKYLWVVRRLYCLHPKPYLHHKPTSSIHPTMASSATSLHFLSFAPQTTLSLSKPNATIHFNSLLIPSVPPSKFCLSVASSFSISPREGPSLSGPRFAFFARRVAVSSDYDQIGVLDEEEVANDDFSNYGAEDDEPSFSPDQKLFVGNLPFSVDSAALAHLFERAGNVEMVEVIYDKHTGRSRGFGFVTMSSAEEVTAATQQFNGYELEGRALRVNSGPPPARKEGSFRGGARGGSSIDNTNRLYVGNLAWGVDDLALETLFSEQGKVMEAKVVYDRESGRSRGFGFVTYSSADEVNNAIELLNGVDLNGRAIRVSPAESRPRRDF